MQKLRMIVTASALVCTVSLAQEGTVYTPMSLKAYTDQLLEEFGEDALVMSAEIYATASDEETKTYYSLVGAAVQPFAIGPVVVPKCTFPPLYDIWVGNTWYVWCEANNVSYPNHEAQQDIYKFVNNRTNYYYSYFYDCQKAADRAAMPTVVRNAVCY